MIRLAGVLLLLVLGKSFAQEKDEVIMTEIKAFQTEQNSHYANKKKSPLSKRERKAFKGHRFYPVDLDYVVDAKFVRIMREDTIEMQTVQNEVKYYRPYAKVYFEIKGTPCELTVYQSLRLRAIKEYENYLFIPFRDATSGKSSYGGGRYMDVLIPEGNTLVLNFNKAYNPYCAYTDGYNCTIPPAENTLNVGIEAGLMTPDGH